MNKVLFNVQMRQYKNYTKGIADEHPFSFPSLKARIDEILDLTQSMSKESADEDREVLMEMLVDTFTPTDTNREALTGGTLTVLRTIRHMVEGAVKAKHASLT